MKQEEPKRGQVVQITKRKCSDKLQPEIKVGSMYFVEGTDRLKDGTLTLLLLNNKKVRRCNAQRFNWRIYTEEIAREEKLRKDEAEGTQKLLHSFTFEEHMQIAFVPNIIIHCAWSYADRVMKYCADHRISEVKKLGRAVKELRKAYDYELAKDLDIHHRKQIQEIGDIFMEETAFHFTTLEFSIRNELLKTNSQDRYIDMHVNAIAAMFICDYYEQQAKDMDNLIASRMGKQPNTITNPKVDALRTCMDAYRGEAGIKDINNVEIGMRVFANDLKKVKFEPDHKKRIAQQS